MSKRSKILANSATKLAVSPHKGEADFDFQLCVKRNADRAAKGTTRERQLLNRNKLVSACCNDYKSHFTAIYGKTDLLPHDIYNRINDEVDKFLQAQFNRVNLSNALSLRRGFYHNFRGLEVTERITILGENKLELKEQLFGCNMFIEAANKRLNDLMQKPTPNFDLEKQTRERIAQLEITRKYIMTEMERQEQLIKDALLEKEEKKKQRKRNVKPKLVVLPTPPPEGTIVPASSEPPKPPVE